MLFVELVIATRLNHQENLDDFFLNQVLAVKKYIDFNFDKNKVSKMEHTRKYYLKRQEKIFLLSKLIDVSSISCTINYTNKSPLRELSLGVCFKLY